jgi:NADH-quinone oxidoreductase subunit L
VHLSTIAGLGLRVLFCVLAGVFVTAFYSFRMYFLVFHGKERFGKATHDTAITARRRDDGTPGRRSRHGHRAEAARVALGGDAAAGAAGDPVGR